jgi:hypothetical protein
MAFVFRSKPNTLTISPSPGPGTETLIQGNINMKTKAKRRISPPCRLINQPPGDSGRRIPFPVQGPTNPNNINQTAKQSLRTAGMPTPSTSLPTKVPSLNQPPRDFSRMNKATLDQGNSNSFLSQLLRNRKNKQGKNCFSSKQPT